MTSEAVLMPTELCLIETAGFQERNEEIQKEYGFCTIDGHTEKIGNFRIEPPGLFRGRGEHPKQVSSEVA